MKIFKIRLALTALGLILGGSGSAKAGLIIVSGDFNITNPLVGIGDPLNPGNQRFFSNVLGGGTHVLIQGSDDTSFPNTYYNSLPGVTSTILSGSVTTSSLAGENLFISMVPTNAFGSGEISALAAFSAAGGTIFLMGDYTLFASQDGNLNDLLVGLNSPMSIIPEDLDPGSNTLSGSHIASNPLTTGVSSLGYGDVSEVSGGTALFTTSGGQTFVAETGLTSIVPEPSSLALCGISCVMVLAYARARRKRSVA